MDKPSSMAKFRKENPRIDYYPTKPALDAVARLRTQYPEATTRECLDMLVTAGLKSYIKAEPIKG